MIISRIRENVQVALFNQIMNNSKQVTQSERANIGGGVNRLPPPPTNIFKIKYTNTLQYTMCAI